jgi:perosamine synthetase
MQGLLEAGISSRRGVMTTHRETAYKAILPDLSLAISEDLQDKSIILPLYVPMAAIDVEFVIATVLRIIFESPIDKTSLITDSPVLKQIDS